MQDDVNELHIIVLVLLFSLERKKQQKSSRQTRSLRAFCRASASSLPKVHLDCLLFCWANNDAGVAILDTSWVRWVAFGNGNHQRRETRRKWKGEGSSV